MGTLHLVPLLFQAEAVTWMWAEGWLLIVRQRVIVPTSFLGRDHQLPLVKRAFGSSQVLGGTHMPKI